MLQTESASYSFLVKHIEIDSNVGVPFLRVRTQSVQLNQKDIEKLRREKRWNLDGVGFLLPSKMISLDKNTNELIVCLMIPFKHPIPVTIGSVPETPLEEIVKKYG